MTYFDPKIYNVKNLKEKDREAVNTADFIVSQTITQLKSSYKDMLEQSNNTLKKIEAEICIETLEDLMYAYDSERRMYITSIIDNYEEDYQVEKYDEFETKITDGVGGFSEWYKE